MGFLQDLFTNQNAQKAADEQNAAIQTGTTQGLGSLNTGLTDATASYTAGLQPFQTNLATTQAGQTAYADATGANGAAGQAAARANFQADPGAAYAVEQASQNEMRHRAATGQLATGGTSIDLANIAQGNAQQNWQQYITNLQPFIGASTANAQGAGNLYSGLGNLQNANYTNQANMQYGSNVAQGNNQANAQLANNQAAQNIFGAVQSGVKLASGLSGFSGAGPVGPTSVGGAPLNSSFFG